MEIEEEKQLDLFLNLEDDPIAEVVNLQTLNRKFVRLTERRTYPYMTKYEAGRLIGFRAAQIENGAPVLIPLDNLDVTRSDLIAKAELYARVIPIKIIRTHSDKTYEVWELKELTIPRL